LLRHVAEVSRIFDETMAVHDFFLHLLAILVSARVFAELATRLKSPSVIGELLATVAGKMAGALLLREPWPARVALGLAMVPRGEVGLIFAELGRSTGILDATVYAAMVIVIALTTLAPPLALKWFYRRYGSRFATDSP